MRYQDSRIREYACGSMEQGLPQKTRIIGQLIRVHWLYLCHSRQIFHPKEVLMNHPILPLSPAHHPGITTID
jgi:hypothetical protein